MTSTQPIIFRCLWCKDRIGHPTFYNQRGETVVVPQWAMPTEISDGICPMCLVEAKQALKEGGVA